MKPGDVFRIAYPEGDGREQAGERPGLVVQDEAFAGRSPLVLTIPLTTTARVTRYPAVVPVPADEPTGLPLDSFALVFQLRATDRSRFRKRIGAVSPAVLAQVYDALDRLTGRTRTP